MARKVEVKLTVIVSLVVDEGVEISKIIDEMDYSFSDTTTKATIEDTEIIDHEITDSR